MRQIMQILCAAATLAATPAAGGEPSLLRFGRDQVRVVDGDTLAWYETRLRLAGLDAPEIGAPGGAAAKGVMIIMLGVSGGEQPLACAAMDADRYGRPLVECVTDTGDLAEAMIRSGYARPWPGYETRYAAALSEAKRHGAGLWRCSAEVPPGWEAEKRAVCPPP